MYIKLFAFIKQEFRFQNTCFPSINYSTDCLQSTRQYILYIWSQISNQLSSRHLASGNLRFSDSPSNTILLLARPPFDPLQLISRHVIITWLQDECSALPRFNCMIKNMYLNKKKHITCIYFASCGSAHCASGGCCEND